MAGSAQFVSFPCFGERKHAVNYDLEPMRIHEIGKRGQSGAVTVSANQLSQHTVSLCSLFGRLLNE